MFSFFMNKINFYFCDLFIVMMLRNQDLPPRQTNLSAGGSTLRREALAGRDVADRFSDLGTR